LPTRFGPRAATSSGIPYQGGPVLVHPNVYLVFWGYKTYGDPDKVATLLTAYLKAMGGSPHNNIYTQYYDELTGKKAYIKNPKMQLGGVWYDQTNKVPKSPTDAQVAQEALAGAYHFHAGGDDSFVVATPHGRSTSGFGTQWCGYHNAYAASGYIFYTNLPYIPDAGGDCGANFITPPKDESGADEGVTIVEGAEEGDSVTDPIPGSGWTDSGGGEISSPCVWTDVENDRFRKRTYTTGTMFSNASLSCVQTYK
jgi:serine protease